MKLTALLLASLTLASSASAQYFSQGWKPGQPLQRAQDGTGYTFQSVASTPTAGGVVPPGAAPTAPAAPRKKTGFFDFSTLLETAPMKLLFDKAGVNITERLAKARNDVELWDERVPLITDDNYNDMIVEEEFATLEEERDRVWFIVMCVLFYHRVSEEVWPYSDLALRLVLSRPPSQTGSRNTSTSNSTRHST